MPTKQIRVSVESLTSLVEQIFAVTGTTLTESQLLAHSLVDANLNGVDSHGVVRVTAYLQRMKAGDVKPGAPLQWMRDFKAAAVLDAGNGWGQTAANCAMEKSIEKAKMYGIGMVVVRNSNHIGTCAYWTKMAAAQGCVGYASTNSSPVVTAWGASVPTLGTNPFSFAVPTSATGEHPPIVLDMATSEVARGKIIVAAHEGRSIPETWALDATGNPTTDPKEAMFGSLLPFGGAKGSGISLIVDILCGVLSGANYGARVSDMYGDGGPQNLGQVFISIDVGTFLDPDEFYVRMQDRVDMTKNSAPSGKSEVFLPGEIERNKWDERMKNGIPLELSLYDELKQLSTDLAIPFAI
jgi:LDH2 family malate/lactate/ureidoglycolate dehydrogenase